MDGKCMLGIDVGTSGCKILALDECGTILGSVVEEYPCYAPQEGWSEQDPEDWWKGVVSGLRKAAPLLKGKTVAAVGLSGQMHGMVALDHKNRVVRRAILWNDQRTGAQCEEITKLAGGPDALLAATNNQMLTGYTGGKILWMKEKEPENYGKTVRAINPKDYIRLKLTGEIKTDVSDASGTGFFCVRERGWAVSLIRKVGLDPDLFPEAVESTAVSGYVTKEAAELTGLPEGTPIGGGGGDAVISTTGLGLAKSGRIGVTVGTSGVVAMSLGSFLENPKGVLQVFCGNEPGSFSAMGVTLAAAGSYQWFRNALGQYEMQKAAAEGKSAFALLDAEAACVPPCCEGMFFLPYLSGERAPLNDPAAKGAFLGVTSRHGKGHFARSVLEGVAFSLRQVYGMIGAEGSSEIVIAGGGAVSPLWRQIFADVFGLPVRTVYGSAEGGSFGAALAAGVTAGVWGSLEETVPLIRPESVTMPIAENVPLYAEHYAKYTKFYEALKWSFH
ncbi:xylulokinase [Caproiciproducens sp. CPB-2]|uniref:xylulokinase n=1 Tax=Caproiciproducens sp. CPB-2 TaxID=3030017 RepID=UPI0023DB8D29|nr:xylulokinase [Caproiciproducens sp. CPB-2]MDF1493803.1 xylulokinase [Caproiciproducens sp. CPB-2]